MSRTPLALSVTILAIVLAAGCGRMEWRACGRPEGELPAHLEAESFGVQLIADFDHRKADGSVPVYLVNGRMWPLSLDTQDNEVFLKLEVRGADGVWRRAQTHAYSGCGNSYFVRRLRAKHFIALSGYQPAAGALREVRFALYEQGFSLRSNVGRALVDERDVARATYDSMAFQGADIEWIASLALGRFERPAHLDPEIDPQSSAIYRLGSVRSDHRRARELLEQVVREFPEYEEDARNSLSRLDLARR